MRRPPTVPPLISLIGRDADVREVEERLERSRVVAVLGPPGVGKTRVAFEAARRLEADGEAIVRVDLTYCTSDDELVQRVAAALETTTRDLPAQIAALGALVLVLDGVDLVVPAASERIATWIESAPALRVLLTSRARPRIPGEVVFDLEPLSEEDAIGLFIDRAARHRRDPVFDLDAVRQLVAAIDYLPLAIELAAARSRVFEPADLVAQLARHRVIYDDRGTTAPLTAALDMSMAALSPSERDVLIQLSVFRGGFTVEAAQSVIALEAGAPNVIDALEALVDHSLVWSKRLGDSRRLGLYRVVRDHAAHELDRRGGRDAARGRHAAFYAATATAWASQVPGPKAPAALAKIEADYENLLAVHRRALASPDVEMRKHALAVALAFDPLLSTRGPLDVGIRLLDAALAATPADHPQRLDALEARASALRNVDVERARAAYAELRKEADAARSRLHAGRALAGEGGASWMLQLPGFESMLDRGLAIARELGDRIGECNVLGMQANVALYRDDLASARDGYSRALGLATMLGDKRLEGIHLGNLGVVEQEHGRLDAARTAFVKSVDGLRQIGDRRSLAWALSNLAGIDHEEGDLASARIKYREALGHHDHVGNRRSWGLVRGHLANCDEWAGDLELARGGYEEALAALDSVGAAQQRGVVLAMLGGVLAGLGLVDDARRVLADAERAQHDVADPGALAVVDVARGHLDLAEGRPDAARRRLDDGLAYARRWSVRLVRQGLERALARPRPEPLPNPNRPALVVPVDGRWFEAPGSARVDLARRRALRLILADLVATRRDNPGTARSVDDLLAAGWPGEQVLPEAGASRVYVAVATLRRMGLSALVRIDDGYRLDPAVPVVVATT